MSSEGLRETCECGHGRDLHPAGACRFFNFPMNCHCQAFRAAQPATGEGLTAWLAMVEDVMGLWGTGEPDMDDVLETLAEHRPHVLLAALQPASEENR